MSGLILAFCGVTLFAITLGLEDRHATLRDIIVTVVSTLSAGTILLGIFAMVFL